VSPFELLKKTMGGSGYDIACAQASGPIKFEKVEDKPQWETAHFNPSFRHQMFFLYLGHKQNSANEVMKYNDMNISNKAGIVSEISQLTREMVQAGDLITFNRVIRSHEDIVSKALGYEKVKDTFFKDFWGEVKSLGAWGGDFVLVTTDRSLEETREYFNSRGFSTLIAYDEIVMAPPKINGRS
jgi:mevalonate kinase